MNSLLSIFSRLFGLTNKEVTKIGSQTWTIKNLNTSTFRNGDIIPEAKTPEEWKKAGDSKQPAWCYYDNRSIQDDPINGTSYGKLYNWYAVTDPRGLAPEGWHVPTDDEWTTLTNYLKGESNAGYKMKIKLSWGYDNFANNRSGFSALPSGLRVVDGSFKDGLRTAYFWTITDFNEELALVRIIPSRELKIERRFYNKKTGLSVRCIKDY